MRIFLVQQKVCKIQCHSELPNICASASAKLDIAQLCACIKTLAGCRCPCNFRWPTCALGQMVNQRILTWTAAAFDLGYDLWSFFGCRFLPESDTSIARSWSQNCWPSIPYYFDIDVWVLYLTWFDMLCSCLYRDPNYPAPVCHLHFWFVTASPIGVTVAPALRHHGKNKEDKKWRYRIYIYICEYIKK